uniref:Uncharacterized protein n=1 Tax=Desertifilum tharense IPPAS B-1220 TaxID=1781255 RepID=A0ACD5H1G9_9CYAN
MRSTQFYCQSRFCRSTPMLKQRTHWLEQTDLSEEVLMEHLDSLHCLGGCYTNP